MTAVPLILRSAQDGALFEGDAGDVLSCLGGARWVAVPLALIVTPTQTDTFAPTPGQTDFTLSQVPLDPANLRWSVNGVLYVQGSDYTIAGDVVTWLDALFTLDTSDECQAFYRV